MKTKKNLQQTVIILIATILHFYVNASEPKSLKELQYKAYLSSSPEMWEQSIDSIEKQLSIKPNDKQLLLELAKAGYGLLNSCLAFQNKEEYNDHVEIVEKNIDHLIKIDHKWSEAHALKAGLLSTKMAFYPIKSIFLGPKSVKHINKAIQYDNKLPQAWKRRANSKYFTPEMYGGDIMKSIECYLKAIDLFELNQNELAYNWEYVDAIVWLGNAYKKAGNKAKAKEIFEKALRIEPNHQWVSKILLPSVLK